VQRVFLVLSGPIDAATFGDRCSEVLAQGVELAVGYELPRGADDFRAALDAQRVLTRALRRRLGERAEGIAIFAICDRDGERSSDYAREWGATEVSR